MVQFWQSQVLCGRFDLVVHRLPIRGHSFLLCDREFGVIEKDQRKKEMVESFTGWEEMIRERFDLTSMKGSDMQNYKEHLGQFYKKSATKGNEKFQVSKYKIFEFSKDRKYDVVVSETMSGGTSQTF